MKLIVAADETEGIGRGGRLPWRIPGDLARVLCFFGLHRYRVRARASRVSILEISLKSGDVLTTAVPLDLPADVAIKLNLTSGSCWRCGHSRRGRGA